MDDLPLWRQLFSNVGIVSPRGGISSWGNTFVRIDAANGTETYGRSGFHLHGGSEAGSAGCIDLVGGNDSFFEYMKNYDGEIELIVDYSGNEAVLSGAVHPLLRKNEQRTDALMDGADAFQLLERLYDGDVEATQWFVSQFAGCFLAGTPISMWDGTEKPIEQVKPGDIVVSYDKDGNLVPGRVSRTKTNRVKHILDVFGLMVTPGHVTLCGDGKFEGRHVPMIDILRSDGALVLEDGSKERAGTNFRVGSLEDRFVHAIVTEDLPGTDQVRVVETGRIRLGTRFMHPAGTDITVLEIIRRTGCRLTDEGYVVLPDGVTKTPFVWTFTNRLPKPEDFVLQRSQVTLEDIYEADEWEAVAPQVPPPYRGALSQSSCQPF